MKTYWYPHERNVGDTLTPHILGHFLPRERIEYVPAAYKGKFLAVGSIMSKLQPGDTVWGTGVMRATDTLACASRCRFLAVRGQLSRDILHRCGGTVPEVYGDPALLLPLMYKPEVQKHHSVGYIPHYMDRENIQKRFDTVIDVALPWRRFVDEVLACERVVSSSLHGIVIAEAYGVPAEWAVWSDKVIGKGFKFRDYLSGTGREPREPGPFPPIPDLPSIQSGLTRALHSMGQTLSAVA